MKLFGMLLPSLNAVFASLLLFAVPAFAQSSQIVGEWRFVIAGEQPWTISSYDPNSGAISGYGAANGYQWTFTGTAIAGSFSINYIYTNLPSYFGTLTATFSDPCTLVSGTWTSSFGQVGSWSGTKVSCSGSGGPQPGEKRVTGISMFCNRSGPGLSEASCAVTVGDSGPYPRTTPSGSVDFVATRGFFPGSASCLLQQTSFSPGVASCTAYFQVPFGFPIATPFPIEAIYGGNDTFEPSATSHELIQAGCIGTPEAPCSGSVALSFADIPQIVEGVLSSVVACGGRISQAVSRPPMPGSILAMNEGFEGGCNVELEATLSAANELADIEEQAQLQEFANQLEQASTNSLGQLERAFLQALTRTAQQMATNERTYASHQRNPTQVQASIRREMEGILFGSPSRLSPGANGKLAFASKRKFKIPTLELTDREGRVKTNKQKAFKQKPTKLTRTVLTALQGAGVGTVDVTLSLESLRRGKLPKGVKRKAKIAKSVSIGLTSLR